VPTLPFFLLDDDAAQWPLLQVPPMGTNAQGSTPFALMQTSDDASRNLYAPAYVKPVYDLRTLGTAPFDRNLEVRHHGAQVNNAQTVQSNANYWVVYLQGAFQDVAFARMTIQGQIVEEGDADPNSEVMAGAGVTRNAVNGRTAAVTNPDGSLSQIGGSTIYRETLREALANLQLDCLTGTVVHETGHQFGLRDNSGGIMEPCSATRQLMFTTDHLSNIRRRPHPQGG
jgi:predicted Zn-dependent protease with MMP-like domain